VITEQLRDVGRVLIIGGGAVGIELAGELIAAKGSKKDVTLLHSGDRLLSSRDDLKEQLRTSLRDQLQSLGVHVILNEKVEMSSLGDDISEREESLQSHTHLHFYRFSLSL
jgi:NADH dehydrogenase FAD-containing subunit